MWWSPKRNTDNYRQNLDLPYFLLATLTFLQRLRRWKMCWHDYREKKQQRAICLWCWRTGSLLVQSHHWNWSRNVITLRPECSASTCCWVFFHWHVIVHGSQNVTSKSVSTKVSRKHSTQHNSAWHCFQRKTFHSRDRKNFRRSCQGTVLLRQFSFYSAFFLRQFNENWIGYISLWSPGVTPQMCHSLLSHF